MIATSSLASDEVAAAQVDPTAYDLATRVVPRTVGVSVSPSAIKGWRSRGVAGIKLRTRQVGGRHYCRPVDVEEFLSAVEQAKAAG